MRLKLQSTPAFHAIFMLAGAIVFAPAAVAQDGTVDSAALIDKYCAVCHNPSDGAGGIDLEFSDAAASAKGRRSVRK
jgi:mono/diheme cytochrome c family protein